MSIEDIIQSQTIERDQLKQKILESKAPKKIIVAGPGTGKTYTFTEILSTSKGGNNLAMTFINLLKDDMESKLGACANVKTLHSYAIGVLHKIKGEFDLFPGLSSIIRDDFKMFGYKTSDYDEYFKNLKDIDFDQDQFHARCEYYNAFSFDYALYLAYYSIKDGEYIPEPFDNIVIDEFQDFNLIEIAFVQELAAYGNILIVGDDDQTVYSQKGSSPKYIREFYRSGEYKIFELPFCNRCPLPIVESTKNIIKKAIQNGYLKDRIDKRFECFIGSKLLENEEYPTITYAQLKSASKLADYVKQEIDRITQRDIVESWGDDPYSTVLIVGRSQYLNKLQKELKSRPNVSRKSSSKKEVNLTINAYKCLTKNIKSNLGWRLLMENFLPKPLVKDIIQKTSDNKTPIYNLLPDDFVDKHSRNSLLLKNNEQDGSDNDFVVSSLIQSGIPTDYIPSIRRTFLPSMQDVEDRTKPSIVLSSFEGCKGLSAGHVFIVGANNGVIPMDKNAITDDEISKFIVALTRTKKKCYILSDKYFESPKDKAGNWIDAQTRSALIDWIDP
ncbi:MAG: UvrD-helicase domain-containing protein, partial [Fermentimonas sp.]